MEYLLGFVAAIVALSVFRFALSKNIKSDQLPKIKYSQSHIHEIIKQYIPNSFFGPLRKKAQSQNHRSEQYTRVVFLDNSAYWIKDNALFVADMENGIVDEETTRRVDTMAMNSVELEKVMHIVEALTEGQIDDRGYPGNKNF